MFFLVILALSLVAAAKSENNTYEVKMERADKVVKNMTYGSCVSENAKVKNDCFASVKEARKSCLMNASDSSVCKTDYKKDLKQCKIDFKTSKKECKKIKHNFVETAQSAFS